MIYYTGDIHGSTLEIVTFCMRFKPTKDDTIVNVLKEYIENYAPTKEEHVVFSTEISEELKQCIEAFLLDEK